MGTEKSLSRYILVVLSVSVVVTAIIIVALNAYVSNKRLADDDGGFISGTTKSLSSYDDGYIDGYNDARDRFSNYPDIIKNINGQVTEIGSDYILITAENLDTNEFVDGVSDLRKVKISTTTSIVQQKALSDEETESRIRQWQESGSNEPLMLVDQEKQINLSEITENSRVEVIAENDIRMQEEFKAIKVILE